MENSEENFFLSIHLFSVPHYYRNIIKKLVGIVGLKQVIETAKEHSLSSHKETSDAIFERLNYFHTSLTSFHFPTILYFSV